MSQTELSRRQFMQTAAATACACALCGVSSASASEKVPTTPLDAGKPDDFANDGVYDQFAKSRHILIVRHDNKLYAPTAVCTHKHCVVRAKDQVIVCPCHNSRYDVDGVPTRGPARKPLVRYSIRIQDGRIIIDPTQTFDPSKWNEPLAFITL
ncbi:MAG: Rieske 2Fe-2S domain-containing protein [Phycisphaerales bacterium]|nr:Rieske 2Fe-2S domain-containing protein [Phycisphaerales bacterium]